MQTIEEYKAYTKQLEGEVKTWKDAYNAIVIERNQLLKQLRKGENDAHKPDNEGRGNDCEQSRNGGGQRTELEVALAKKCLHLSEKLAEVNNQRNSFLEGLYSALLRIEKAGGEHLKAKRLADLTANEKASEKRTEKLKEQIKGIIGNGTGESQQGSGAGEA